MLSMQHTLYEALKRLGRLKLLRGFIASTAVKLRKEALLREDFVPYDIHRFDKLQWVLKETSRGYRIWCSLDERAICRPILLDCYERSETLFTEANVRPGDVAVDAGANVGYFSLLLASLVGPSGRVEAYEPLTYLSDALSASIIENGYQSRITVHRAALDSSNGSQRIRHAPRTANFGGAHLATSPSVPEAHIDEEVETVRLDDELPDLNCQFIKLDVEGAEPRVIAGAIAVLARSKPIILSELHNHQLKVVSGVTATEFIGQMASLEYECHAIRGDGTRTERLTRYEATNPINVVFDPI